MWEKNNEIDFGRVKFDDSVEQLGGMGEQTNGYTADELRRQMQKS